MEPESKFNREKEFEIIKKDLLRLYKPIIAIKDLKIKDQIFDDDIKKITERLPKSSDLINSYDETVKRLNDFVKKSEILRKESFSKIKNKYLENLKNRNEQFRLIDNLMI